MQFFILDFFWGDNICVFIQDDFFVGVFLSSQVVYLFPESMRRYDILFGSDTAKVYSIP